MSPDDPDREGSRDTVEEIRLERAIAEYHQRLDREGPPDRAAFLGEHPSCAAGLREYFETLDLVERMAGPAADRGGPAPPPGAGESDWDRRVFPFSFGRYRVLKRLGRGGMGTVYLAHDTHLQRPVALKIPRQDGASDDPRWRERFLREARSTVSHPNVCTVFDAGIRDGQPYISMAYIDGHPLSTLIGQDEPLPEAEAAALVCILARALAAVHEAGIVHRDLKPSNVLVDGRGQPIVTDFGLAFRPEGPEHRLTTPGLIVGTLSYLSPEQIERNPGAVSASSDIYSLGVLFYELLTGRRPFRGSSAQILDQIRNQAPDPPSGLRPGIDRALEAICLKMMAKRAADRHATMAMVADDLHAWLERQAGRSETAEELRSLRGQVRKLGVSVAASAATLGLLELAELLASHHAEAQEHHADDHVSHAEAPHHDGPIEGGWHSPFEALAPEPHPIDHADPHFGTPEHDGAFWQGRQSYDDTCAIRCQEFILQQFTGVDFPESFLVEEAREHGWYRPGHGSSLHDVGNLLELHGVAVYRYEQANVFHLTNELAQGHKVIIAVDSSKLWGRNETMDSLLECVEQDHGRGTVADHAVVVSGIDTTDPRHVRVILSDPGDGKAMASYPLEQFLSAWEGSHFTMVATRDPAPPHLPEMIHFDYASGHLGAIADVPYDRFVEHFAGHPESWEHALDQFTSEHLAHDHHDHGHGASALETGDHDHAHHHGGAWHDDHDDAHHHAAHDDPHDFPRGHDHPFPQESDHDDHLLTDDHDTH